MSTPTDTSNEDLLVQASSENRANQDGSIQKLYDSQISHEDDLDGKPAFKKTLIERYFSPIKPGSLRSSIFALSCFCMGMGTMALPYAVFRLSFVGGCTMIVISALCGYWSLSILISSAERLESVTYNEAVKKAYGVAMCRILDVSVLLNIIGNLISYTIVSKYIY